MKSWLCLQRADVTAEAGAGIYFSERRALVEALHHLLQLHALPDADAPKDIQSAVDSFVESLLSETSGGRSNMIARLVELIGVSKFTLHRLNVKVLHFCRRFNPRLILHQSGLSGRRAWVVQSSTSSSSVCTG